MASVVWSDAAIRHLIEIGDYLQPLDANASRRIVNELKRADDSLADFPNRGRPAEGGKRELISVPPYVIRYRIDRDTVYILRVRHGRSRPRA